jgi:hypothetical protein
MTSNCLKPTTGHPYADPEATARKLVELARGVTRETRHYRRWPVSYRATAARSAFDNRVIARVTLIAAQGVEEARQVLNLGWTEPTGLSIFVAYDRRFLRRLPSTFKKMAPLQDLVAPGVKER